VRNWWWISGLVMVKRRDELDFRDCWGFYIVLIWNNSNFSTVSFPPYLCSIRRNLYCYGSIMIVPDTFDILGAGISLVGVIVIFYLPRHGDGEKSIWSRQQ
jgi:hypothetical protein